MQTPVEPFRFDGVTSNAITRKAVLWGIDRTTALKRIICQACPEDFPAGYEVPISERNKRDWRERPAVYREDV